MHAFLAPASVGTLFVAGVLFFVVAERLSLVSAKATLAIRLCALMLFGTVVLGMPIVLLRLPMMVGTALFPLLNAASWGCLAWAAWALLMDAPKEGVR